MVVIEEVLKPEGPEFMEGYKLIRESLPPTDMESLKEYVKVFKWKKNKGIEKKDNFHFLVAKNLEEIVAVATGYYISKINCGYVEATASKPDYRGRGLGITIRKAIVEKFKQDALTVNKDLKGCVGEVSPSNPWLKKMIKELNILPLDIDYVQPRKNQEKPMVLYFQPIKGVIEQLPKEEGINIVKTIYKWVYNMKDVEQNPTFKKVISSTQNKEWIGRKKLI